MNVSDWLNEGYAHYQAGRYGPAEALFRRVLKKQPRHFLASLYMGSVLFRRGRLGESLPHLERAVAAQPDFAEGWNNLGCVLLQLRRPGEAEASLRRALALKPAYPEALVSMGMTLLMLRRVEEAVAPLQSALRRQPNDVHTLTLLGGALRDCNRHSEAAAALRRAVTLQPGCIDNRLNLAGTLVEWGQPEEAAPHLRAAGEALEARLIEEPNSEVALHQLGLCRQEQQEFASAAACYRKVLSITADGYLRGSVLHQLAQCLAAQKHNAEALECLAQAVLAESDNVAIRQSYSAMQMRLGNYAEGWAGFERCRQAVDSPFPRWTGESLAGKSVLVHAEQGAGDTLQFVRFLPLVKARGAHVHFLCQTSLSPLLRDSAGADGIGELAIGDGHLQAVVTGPFDYQLPLMSVPYVLGATLETLPAEVPYVRADPRKVSAWRDRFAALLRLDTYRVGLVWAGNPTFRNDHNRSASLAEFAPLARLSGVQFVSLQKGPAAAQASAPPDGMDLLDIGADLHDFSDTAAAANLDLVIAVDTAVAHLAGAMGRPVWTLLPAVADWRWLLDRDDSPWYPTMRLFRQDRPRDWASVLERVARALAPLGET